MAFLRTHSYFTGIALPTGVRHKGILLTLATVTQLNRAQGEEMN